jgi:hypothetical protein
LAAAANVAAAEVPRAYQLINDQIDALGTFTGVQMIAKELQKVESRIRN